VHPRAGLDNMKKRKFLTLLEPEVRTLGGPASRQPLYRLRYKGPYTPIEYNLHVYLSSCSETIISPIQTSYVSMPNVISVLHS
jgi:hypothetical protein